MQVSRVTEITMLAHQVMPRHGLCYCYFSEECPEFSSYLAFVTGYDDWCGEEANGNQSYL